MSELVSIVVAIYRIEDYIEECVLSIINQSYKNLEIILIDDGSDDLCPEICDKFAIYDNRIKVLHKKNSGLYKARQSGLLAATGKYICFVDGDDFMEKNMIKRLVTLAEENQVSCVQCGIFDFWDNEKKSRYPYFEEGCYKDSAFVEKIGKKFLYTGEFFKQGLFPYMWGKIFEREKIKEYQMLEDTTHNIFEDAIVFYPFIANSKSIYISHECLYNYRVRAGSQKRTIRDDVPLRIYDSYVELLKRFEVLPVICNGANQLKYYMLYNLLAKAIYVFDEKKSDKYLIPYGDIKKTDKIVLYGAGVVGIFLENYINNINKGNMVKWVDKNFARFKKEIGISSPCTLLKIDFDYIVISILSKDAVESAKIDLQKMGIEEHKILWIKDRYLDEPDELLKLAKVDGKNIFSHII